MTTISQGTDVLDEAECWRLLERSTVGRLAVDIAGKPDIFPVNFVVDNGTVLFRTAAGTKLAAAALLHHVAFEIDGYEPHGHTAWSVVIKGWAQQVEAMDEVFAAEDAPLFPWVVSKKPNFVRITPREVTGRRFHVLEDVDADASIGWNRSDDSKSWESS